MYMYISSGPVSVSDIIIPKGGIQYMKYAELLYTKTVLLCDDGFYVYRT
jgi:hypothetical protein